MITQANETIIPIAKKIIDALKNETMHQVSESKILDAIGKYVGRSMSEKLADSDPTSFATRLLLFYKIGSCICSCQTGYIPRGIMACFSGYDAERIYDLVPSLVRRLFLCTPDDLDIEEGETEVACEVFGQLTGCNLVFEVENPEPVGEPAEAVAEEDVWQTFPHKYREYKERQWKMNDQPDLFAILKIAKLAEKVTKLTRARETTLYSEAQEVLSFAEKCLKEHLKEPAKLTPDDVKWYSEKSPESIFQNAIKECWEKVSQLQQHLFDLKSLLDALLPSMPSLPYCIAEVKESVDAEVQVISLSKNRNHETEAAA
jgi:hypothetical protein